MPSQLQSAVFVQEFPKLQEAAVVVGCSEVVVVVVVVVGSAVVVVVAFVAVVVAGVQPLTLSRLNERNVFWYLLLAVTCKGTCRVATPAAHSDGQIYSAMQAFKWMP